MPDRNALVLNLPALTLLALTLSAPARSQRQTSVSADVSLCPTSGSAACGTSSSPSASLMPQARPITKSSHGTGTDQGITPVSSALASPSQMDATKVPLYQSWYLYLALLFIGIMLPAHFFRRHMIAMKGRLGIVLEERSRIASECHDTLMAGFAAISWQLEATSKLFRDSGLDATPAAESCELARSMVAHCQAEARRIIWDLRETDEVTGILSQALAHSLAANHRPGTIETRLQVEGEEVPLAPGCVHHLVCIGQEAVTNAIRHAHPTSILVHIKYDPLALYLSVRDDGRGFQPDRGPSRHGHFGIAVMEERARKLGGSFRIQEASGSGTEVMVKVPFNTTQQWVTNGPQIIRWIGI